MIPNVVYGVLDGIWPMILIFIVVVSLVRLFSLYGHGQKIVIYKEFITLLFAVYLLLLFELVSNSDMQSISNNFQPFREISRYSLSSPLFFRNVIGNVIMFIPFGIFVSYYIKKSSFWKIFFLSIVTSFTIEAVQSKIGRSFDIDDIILNVLGGLLGLFSYKMLEKIKRYLPKFLVSDLILNLISISLFVILLLLFFNYTGIWRFLYVFN